MKNLYETLRNALLKAIAYKFEVRAEISEALTGMKSGAREAAKELSRVIANEASGVETSDAKIRNLQYALKQADFQ